MNHKESVGVAELKSSLSATLRTVKSGRTVTVLDRGHPVAQIVPYQEGPRLKIRKATRTGEDFMRVLRRIKPLPAEQHARVMAALEEMERKERER